MADLNNLQRWVAFVPDIGNNRAQPPAQQLILEVAASLPKETLLQFSEQLKSPTLLEGERPDDGRYRLLSQHVRLVGEHRLGGVEVKTLVDYARVCAGLTGQYNLREIFAAVGYFNSLSGTDALFSERLSGGTAFMLPQSAAPDGN